MTGKYIIQIKAKTGGFKYVLSCEPRKAIQYTASKDMALQFHNLTHAKNIRDDAIEVYKPAVILRVN